MNSTQEKNQPGEDPAGPAPKVSGWGKGRARAYWLAMFLFTAVFAGFLSFMSQDFRGQPIYPNTDVVPGASTEEVKEFYDGVPFVIEFDALQADYNEIYWVNLLSAQDEEIGVTIENLTKGTTVGEVVTETGENTIFEPNNEIGDRMRITMRWLRPEPPHLLLAKTPPSSEVTLTKAGNEENLATPIFYFGRKESKKAEWDRSLLLVPGGGVQSRG